ncbi:ribosomal protein S18-alanine N-acetyltransferase [Gayadomonas joobiniege]|uniref:ribosomal protein S18-alanine N-acetyltransferase n=1 Tax=Gayadomonas joobiniege TaxID=1234606 RepID=UPI00035F5454|nr:ribosomal protein S18-alanine N-acetyltransferase [Gayadomonas joobiniege]
MNKPQIKPATLADLKAMLCIEQAEQAFPWSQALLSSCFGPTYQNWLVVHNKELAGYLISQQVVDEVSLLNICIAKKYQRRGFASLLHQQLLQGALLQQCAYIWLEVRSDNHAAIKFYQQLGYRSVSVRKNYYAPGIDALNMQYLLLA